LNPLAENYASSLRSEAEQLEKLADEIEATAKQYGQVACFKPYVEKSRQQASELRELIERMYSDPVFH